MRAEEAAEPLPGLTLMPEYGVEVPVWHGPDSQHSGNVGAEELLAMGVSSGLAERLRAWQEGWEHDPSRGWVLRGSSGRAARCRCGWRGTCRRS
ncbi:hypothetical protein BKA19_1071 [Blastococcus saxobsidens]|uniref:Uncharacterized protein n=1 Tax=Blastococcus saxobsidens TaxID=138336 RepID=A0A4Q7Y3H6_9ACTN|nr:hypothetical protein BKA19_1071 [Blastococcus saxobsidens]